MISEKEMFKRIQDGTASLEEFEGWLAQQCAKNWRSASKFFQRDFDFDDLR